MGKFIDLTGQRFGKLIVIERAEDRVKGRPRWLCKCECGNTTIVLSNSLLNGSTKSCGCSNRKDITGQRFGKLVAIRDVGSSNKGKRSSERLWECVCDCGKTKIAETSDLTSGKIKSCGCSSHEGRAIDITGQKFGKLTAIERANNKGKQAGWRCICECGKEIIVGSYELRSGHTKSCGCTKTIGHRLIDLTGQKFGNLTVLRRAGTGKANRQSTWLCQCECGNTTIVISDNLRSGHTKSCGECDGKNRIISSKGNRIIDYTGMQFGKLTVLSYVDGKKWKCVCECGSIKVINIDNIVSGKTQSCGCIASRGEEYISKYLSSIDVHYINQYTFKDLRTSRNGYPKFDFALFKNDSISCLIEYQGEQHYKEIKWHAFGKQQREETDQLKRDYCNEHNIPLHEIRYDQDIETELNKILKLHNLIIPCQAADEAEGVTTIPEGSRAEAKLLSPKRCASANEYADEEIVYSPE